MKTSTDKMTVIMQLVVMTCILMTSLPSTGGVPTRQCVCSATSGGTGVNIRTCGNTTCQKVGDGLGDSDCLNYAGESEGPWVKVHLPNDTVGWLHSGYASGPQLCGGVNPYIFPTLCSSKSENKRRNDENEGGHFNASRGSDFHLGVDIECGTGDKAYAPIDGLITKEVFPEGTGLCCDTGYEIQGRGDWMGYVLNVYNTKPDVSVLGKEVEQGDVVGIHVGMLCDGCLPANENLTEHVHVEMYYKQQLVDPSSFIFAEEDVTESGATHITITALVMLVTIMSSMIASIALEI